MLAVRSLVFAAVLAGVACQTPSTPPKYLTDGDRRSHVTEIAEEYCAAIRWDRSDIAVEHVRPEMRNAWVELLRETQRTMAFSGFEIVGVDLSVEPTRVDVHVLYESYSATTLLQSEIREHQVWTYDAEAERWFVTPDLDAFEPSRAASSPRRAPRGS